MLIEAIYKYPKRAITAALIVLLIIASLVWWNVVWQSPNRVFDGMLASNLSTTSVTKYAGATSGDQGIAQYIRLQLGSTNASTWLVTVKQTGSSITTESIGTPEGGYVRYINISTNQKHKDNSPFDFSSVLNVWGKSDPKDSTSSLNQLFNQSLLDISTAPLPPIGNLTVEKRQQLIDEMKQLKVFTVDYKTVKSEKLSGKSVYTYKVSVNLGAYVQIMKTFARDMGQTNLESVDPNQYSAVKPVELTMSVARSSHQLVKISQPTTLFEQTYSDWGLNTPTKVPAKSIPVSELQKRFSKLE